MSMPIRLAAWATLTWCVAIAATPAFAQRPASPAPGRDAAPPPSAEDEVVVVAGRPKNTVPGDAVPQITLNPADIRAQGVSSVTELLSAIASQIGTARGRGASQPVVLLNGRRVSDFREIATLPTEAIARVEVFTEEVALQYGYSADQRVVNFILRNRFKAVSSEASLGDIADHAADKQRGQIGYLKLRPDSRLQLDGSYQTQSAVTQLERGLFASPGGIDDRALRTVSPDSDTLNLTGVFNKGLSKTLAATASLTVQNSESASLLGLDSGTGRAIRSTTNSTNARAALTIDRSGPRWLGNTTLSIARSESTRDVNRSVSPSSARSEDMTYQWVGDIQGPIYKAPAGPIRISAHASLAYENLDTESVRASVLQSAGIDRTDLGGRFTVNAPVVSPDIKSLALLKDVSVNVSAAADSISDFQTVSTFGAGANWAPSDTMRFSMQGSWGENAPDLQQLGAPSQTTPRAIIFDPRTGQSVSATTISGGNSALRAERRNDLTINGSWSPKSIEGLTLNGSYVHNVTRNGISDFPDLSTAVEAAFPTRVLRDGTGALISVDRRAINIAERTSDTVRLGINFSRAFGPKITPPWGSGPPPWLRGAGATEQPGAASTPADSRPWRPPPGFDPPPGGAPPPGAGGPGPGGFGGFGGRGGFQNARVGRFSGSIYYTRRLADDATLANGVSSIDLLQNAILGNAAGADKIEIEGGAIYRGLGFRLSGTWNSDYQQLGLTPAQDLSFSDVTTLNLRVFMNFDSRPLLTHNHPILRGVRLVARADNLFDEAPDVKDGTGATPYAYQKGLLSPQGRVVEVGLRKLF